MNLNARLSVVVNQLVERYDNSVKTEGTVLSQAAHSDLRGRSGNFTLFGFLIIFLLVSGLWFADRIADLLLSFGLPVTRDTAGVGLMVLLVVAIWAGILVSWFSKKRQREEMSKDFSFLVQLFEELGAHAESRYGMFSENLDVLRGKMMEAFSHPNKKFGSIMLELCNELLGKKEFSELVNESPRLESLRQQLVATLTSLRKEV